MKKIVSLSSLVLSIGIFLWVSKYTKSAFDYQTAQYLGYLFYWAATVFIISLLALSLKEKNYKLWLWFTGVCVVASLFFAYKGGSGSGMILSFDGKLLTWFFAGVYSFISVVYFIVQFVKSRR